MASNKSRLKFKRVVIAPEQYSREQILMQQMFNGEKVLMGGTGKNLPKREGVLITGEGLVKNGDIQRRTGKMFGLKGGVI